MAAAQAMSRQSADGLENLGLHNRISHAMLLEIDDQWEAAAPTGEEAVGDD